MAKRKKGKNHTQEERAEIMARVKAEMATGATLKEACLSAGSYPSQFRYWSTLAPAPQPAKSNGGTRPALFEGGTSPVSVNLSWGVILTIDGTRHHLSLEDARIIHEGLSALISKP